MIQLQVNGDNYVDFKSAEYTASMLDFTNEATFQVGLKDFEQPPFFPGDDAKVLVDGEVVMTGYIYDAQVEYEANKGSGNHVLTYLVRDYTADFADSDIDNLNDLANSLSLADIIREVISHVGASNIEVSDEVDGLEDFDPKADGIAPELGENCFDYCDRLAKKRQVLITTNAEGNISLTRNSGVRYKGKIQNSFDDEAGNNIISGNYTFTFEGVYNRYVVRSSLGTASARSPFADAGADSNSQVSDQFGEFIDDTVRTGRQKVIVAEEASKSADNSVRAKWEADFGRTKNRQYTIVVRDHSLQGEVYQPNRIVQVYDDDAGVNDFLLIESVRCYESPDDGRRTELVLVDKESFSLTVSEPQRQKKSKTKVSIFDDE